MKKRFVIGILFLSLFVIFLSFVISLTISLSDFFSNSVSENLTSEGGLIHLNISDPNLILYLPFDYNSSSGTVYDYTNNSNDATMINFADNHTIDGFYGGAYEFDGVDDSIQTSSFSFNSSLNQTTYSFWVYHYGNVSTSGQAYFVSGTQSATTGYVWFYRGINNNHLNFPYANGTSVRNAASYNYFTGYDNQWVFVTLTVDYINRNIVFYRNGVAFSSPTITDSLMLYPNENAIKYIGGKTTYGFMNGSIDEFMIFDKVLNSTEVTAIYNNQSSRFLSSGNLNYSYEISQGYSNLNITSFAQNNSKVVNLTVYFYNGTWNNAGTNVVYDGVNSSFSISPYSSKINLSYFLSTDDMYSPFLKDNVTYELFGFSDVVNPLLTPISPSIGTYRFSNIDFNISSNENLSYCKFSLDNWETNYTMTQFNVTYFNYTNSSMLNGSYIARFWCNDSVGNINDTVIRVFNINTTVHSYSNPYYKINTTSTGGLNFYLLDGTPLVLDGFIFQAEYTNLTNNYSVSGLYPSITETTSGTKTNFTFVYLFDYSNVTYIYQFDDNSPYINLDISVSYNQEIYVKHEYLELNYSLENSKIITANNRLEDFYLNKSYFIDEWTEKQIYNSNLSLLNLNNFQSLDYISEYNFSIDDEYSADSNTLLLCHFNDSYVCNEGKSLTNTSTTFSTGKWESGVNVSGSGRLSFKANSTYINASQGTIEFWFKPDWSSGPGAGLYNQFFAISSNLYLQESDNGTYLSFIFPSRSVTTAQNFTSGEWSHLAVLWNTNDSGKCKLEIYIDGILKANTLTNKSACPVNQSTWEALNFYIMPNSNYAINGTIDEFRILNIAKAPDLNYIQSEKLRLTLDDLNKHKHKYMVAGEIFYNNEYLREIGSIANYSLKISINNSYSTLKKERFPNTYDAALSFTSHADNQNQSIYETEFYGISNSSDSTYGTKGFVKNNIRTTISIFTDEDFSAGSHYDLNFINFLSNISNAGNEIVLHSPEGGNDNRTVVNNSLNNISYYFGEIHNWIDHGGASGTSNSEDLARMGWNLSDNNYYVLDIFEEHNLTYAWSYFDSSTLNYGLNMWRSNLTNYSTDKMDTLIWYNNNVDNNKSDDKHIYLWSTVNIGSSYFYYYNSLEIDRLIDAKGLHFGHVYLGYTPDTQNKLWYFNDDGVMMINDSWESTLNYMSEKQEGMELWIDTSSSIIDHLIKVRDTEVSYPISGNTYGVKYIKHEGYDRFNYADGITLSSESNISSAMLDNGNYLIFVKDNEFVLNRLINGNLVNVTLSYGTYSSTLPRLIKIAPYVYVEKAEYNPTTKGVNLTVSGEGSNKNISLIYKPVSNFAVYDNNEIIATIASGIISSSNSSYLFSYNYSLGNLNFTIPSMSRHEILIVDATPSTSTASSSDSGSSNYNLGVFKPTQESLKNGYSVNIATNQKVVIDSSKTATINSVSESEVGFSISGSDYIVANGESIKIDTNSDGVYDLAVTNNGVTGSYANLEFKIISEAVPSEIQQDESGNVIENIPEVVKKIDWKIWVLVGIVVVLVILYFVFRKRK